MVRSLCLLDLALRSVLPSLGSHLRAPCLHVLLEDLLDQLGLIVWVWNLIQDTAVSTHRALLQFMLPAGAVLSTLVVCHIHRMLRLRAAPRSITTSPQSTDDPIPHVLGLPVRTTLSILLI